MTLPLKCRCGAVRGEMQSGRAFTRATCYCKDCRAYARLRGQRASPFFDGGGQPLRSPEVVSREQRHALERGDSGVPNP